MAIEAVEASAANTRIWPTLDTSLGVMILPTNMPEK